LPRRGAVIALHPPNGRWIRARYGVSNQQNREGYQKSGTRAPLVSAPDAKSASYFVTSTAMYFAGSVPAF